VGVNDVSCLVGRRYKSVSPKLNRSFRALRSTRRGRDCDRICLNVLSWLKKSRKGPSSFMTSTAKLSSLTGIPVSVCLGIRANSLSKTKCDAAFEYPQTINQVGACQRWNKACACLFTNIDVTEKIDDSGHIDKIRFDRRSVLAGI